MFEKVKSDLVRRGLDRMRRAKPAEKVEGVLGAKRSDGTVCFCALGFICAAMADEGKLMLQWVSVDELGSNQAITEQMDVEFTEQGFTHLAVFDGCIMSLPADAVNEIGADEEGIYVGNQAESMIGLMKLNDNTDASPAEIVARIDSEGLYIWPDDEA